MGGMLPVHMSSLSMWIVLVDLLWKTKADLGVFLFQESRARGLRRTTPVLGMFGEPDFFDNHVGSPSSLTVLREANPLSAGGSSADVTK